MTPKLAAALLAAQRAMPAVHKDSKAEVPTKTGKSFSYTYLSLQGLLEVVLPVLNEHGLALTQIPTLNDGRSVLRTTLYHESGESLEADSPLVLTGNETPQTWGGAVTYARRYALTALLGIAADEDDDAASASAQRPRQNRTANGTPATEAATKRIHAIISELAKQRNVPRERVHDALKGALGIESMANLTAENAAKADGILAGWQQKVAASA